VPHRAREIRSGREPSGDPRVWLVDPRRASAVADEAAALADDAAAALHEAQEALTRFRLSPFAGFRTMQRRSYAEARLTAALVSGVPLPGPDDSRCV